MPIEKIKKVNKDRYLTCIICGNSRRQLIRSRDASGKKKKPAEYLCINCTKRA